MKFANAAEQYQRFPELKKEDVTKLLDWMQSQPRLPEITEFEMILFLHSNYCQIEATKTTIEKYYNIRTSTDVFHKRDILGDDMKLCHEVFVMTALPQATKEGYRVLLGKFMNTEPAKFNLNAMFKLFTFVSDAFLMEEGPQQGHIIILDLQGVQLGHITRLGLMSIKSFLGYLQQALPFRIKGLHFINVVPFVDKIIFFMKPFMKKELWEVFHLHTTMESVHKLIDPEILPSNYPGGKAASLAEYHEQFYKHLVEERDYFLEEEQTRRLYDKKSGKPKNVKETAKIETDFRKLELD